MPPTSDTVTFTYRVYGLGVVSNRPLPHALQRPLEPGRPVIEVRFDESPPANAPRKLYGDERLGLEFALDRAGGRLYVNWCGAGRHAYAIQNASSFLLGPVLGGLLRLHEFISLHGCVVEVAGSARVFVASTGAGKSSLAATFAERGYGVLSDDVAALTRDAGWRAHPGYPRLRLHPSAIEAVEAAGAEPLDAGAVVVPAPKRLIALSAGAQRWRFVESARPVEGIYVLERAVTTETSIERLAGARKLTALLEHRRPAIVPVEAEVRAQEFAQFVRLAMEVPVHRLVIPDSLDALPAVCDRLEDT